MPAAEAVVLEILAGGVWRLVGPALAATDDPGSVSREEPHRREVYLFGFQDGRPGVWRSRGGVDYADPQHRIVLAQEGLEQLSNLAEPYELPADRHRTRIRVRAAAAAPASGHS